jgi:ketosteroid isomerase-like protein
MSVETNEDTVTRLGKAFGSGNLEEALACLTEDVVWELPAPPELPYGGRYEGHAGYTDWYHRVKDTLRFKKVDVQPPVGQGGTVVLLGHEFGTAKPTGQEYQYTWAQVYSFADDGRISAMLQYFNPADILRALAEPSSLPSIPAGFGLPFFYSSLTNFEVMYLVDPGRAAPYLEGTGLAAATFDGRACVSYNYQCYTGQFPFGTGVTQEIEFNIVSYPEALKSRTAEMSFEEFVLGNDQTKLFGNHRVHVPCDSPPAIAAGVQLFGEPKFQTTFATSLPALNDPSVETWSVTCNDPDDAKVAIFTGTADLRGLPVLTADISPQTEYGRHDGELIGCRWNILQPFRACMIGAGEAGRVGLQLGQSRHQMRADLDKLIGDAPAAAVRTFQSAPAAIQSRAYFV